MRFTFTYLALVTTVALGFASAAPVPTILQPAFSSRPSTTGSGRANPQPQQSVGTLPSVPRTVPPRAPTGEHRQGVATPTLNRQLAAAPVGAPPLSEEALHAQLEKEVELAKAYARSKGIPDDKYTIRIQKPPSGGKEFILWECRVLPDTWDVYLQGIKRHADGYGYEGFKTHIDISRGHYNYLAK